MDEAEEMEQQRPLKGGYYEADLKAGEWVVPQRYQNLKPIGIGTFGTVW